MPYRHANATIYYYYTLSMCIKHNIPTTFAIKLYTVVPGVCWENNCAILTKLLLILTVKPIQKNLICKKKQSLAHIPSEIFTRLFSFSGRNLTQLQRYTAVLV